MKVANALAASLITSGLEAEAVKADGNAGKAGGADLVCVGDPVHTWNMTKPVKDLLDALKNTEGVAGKKAFAFDTKMKTRLGGSAADKIEKKLKAANLTIARNNESAIVLSKEGPLEEGTEEKFKQIGMT